MKLCVFAQKCSWCDEPFSRLDRILIRLGVKITHGLCRDCERSQSLMVEEG